MPPAKHQLTTADAAAKFPALGELDEDWHWWWTNNRPDTTLIGLRAYTDGTCHVLFVVAEDDCCLAWTEGKQQGKGRVELHPGSSHLGADALADLVATVRCWPEPC